MNDHRIPEHRRLRLDLIEFLDDVEADAVEEMTHDDAWREGEEGVVEAYDARLFRIRHLRNRVSIGL